ncbi:MAG: hypothetical protein ACYSU0_17205 [Planctomycetota bacterium]|jgi:hypothetical protein
MSPAIAFRATFLGALCMCLASRAPAQERPPLRHQVCGNDPRRRIAAECRAAREKLRQRQEEELNELTKDAKDVDWERVVELRRRHIREWHQWEKDARRDHPKWIVIGTGKGMEVSIRYRTNAEYLYYHAATLREQPPALISTHALASAWNRWPNQPYRLDTDDTRPGTNIVPRGGPTTTEHAYIHLPSASLVDRVEFELVGVPEAEMVEGQELKLAFVRFDGVQIYTKWVGGTAVAEVPRRFRPLHPYEVGLHRHHDMPEFAARNVRVYGWTLKTFPFDLQRKKAVTPEEARRTASSRVRSDVQAGGSMAVSLQYLAREHIHTGMTRAEVEALLGVVPVTGSRAVYEARTRMPHALDRKLYGTLTIGYVDDVVKTVTFSSAAPAEVGRAGDHPPTK